MLRKEEKQKVGRSVTINTPEPRKNSQFCATDRCLRLRFSDKQSFISIPLAMADRSSGDGVQADDQEWAAGLEPLPGKEFSLPNLSCKLFEFWVDGDLNKYPSAFETTTDNALAHVSKFTILMAKKNLAALYQVMREAQSASNLPDGQGPNVGGSAHDATDAKCVGLISQPSEHMRPPRSAGSKRHFTSNGKRPPRSPEVPQRNATTQHLGYANAQIQQQGPRTEAGLTKGELQLEDQSSQAEATPCANVADLRSSGTDGFNKKQRLCGSNMMEVVRL
uniref:Uncharacterized protein n=1 Tax=Kalanchoe fedtschenkoi TaxID=63787 RepID=A0A7N0ZSD3_KALFE